MAGGRVAGAPSESESIGSHSRPGTSWTRLAWGIRLRRVAQDFHFGVAGNGCLGSLVHFLRDGAVEVVLAAVIADIGGHIADDHHRPAPLQRNRHRTRTGLTILAEKARHGSLLVLKSVPHSSGSGR